VFLVLKLFTLGVIGHSRGEDTVSLLQTRAAQVTGEFEGVDFNSLLKTRAAANVTGEFEGVDFSKEDEKGGVLRSQVPLKEDDDEGETLAVEGDDREGALMEKGRGNDDQAEATLLLQAIEADVVGAEVLKNLKDDGASDSQINAVALDCAHKFHDGNDETVINAHGMAMILVKEGFTILQTADLMDDLDTLSAIAHVQLAAATTLIQKSVTMDQTLVGKCSAACQASRTAASARATKAREEYHIRVRAAALARHAAGMERNKILRERRAARMEVFKNQCLVDPSVSPICARFA